jgi:beta-fructofuranosidase
MSGLRDARISIMRRREFLGMAAAVPLAAGTVPATKMADDPQRPQYHFLPAANWMNDPNGPIYWQGQYHMFYQYNPNGAYWGDMHWGHAVSADMVHWKHLPVALAPTPGGPDKDGVFSGCAIVNGGVPTVVYTGVNPETQCVATSDDRLIKWEKYSGNPVIAGPPAGFQVAGFRDPAVWKEGDGWLMALGSGFRGRGGAALLYESKDLRHWNYLHPLLANHVKVTGYTKDPVDSGEMWECPDFFPLGGQHVLIVSTQRVVKYMVGSYKRRRLDPESEGIVDFGNYYAARTMTNTGERRILWGWVTEGRNADAQKAAGWSGVMSLPRELSMGTDGKLRIRPAAEVEKLRGKRLAEGAGGDCVEIRAEIDPAGAARAGLKLRATPEGSRSEQTLVYYDRAAKRLTADRSQASLDTSADRGAQSGAFELADGEPLRLRVFVDGSVIEVIANERACLTTRVYPTLRQSTGIGLYASGGEAKLVSMEAWEMRPISGNRLTS